MGIREADTRAMVQVRNAFGAPAERNIFFYRYATPQDMEVIIDPLGVAVPRLALLMTKWAISGEPKGNAGMVELRNAFGPQAPADLFGRLGVKPRFLALVGDTQVAMLGVRTSDGRPEVELHNVSGPPVRSVLRFRDGFTPLDFAATGDVDGDGNPELIMLSRRDVDGLAFLQVQNTDRSNFRILMMTSAALDPAGSMAVTGDVDGDEVAVLLSRQTDARMRAELTTIGGPGTGSHAHVWVSSP